MSFLKTATTFLFFEVLIFSPIYPQTVEINQKQIDVWQELGDSYYQKKNWDSAYIYLEKVWMAAEEKADWGTFGNSGAGIAATRYFSQDFECMEKVLQESLEGVEKYGTDSAKQNIPTLLNLLGVLYGVTGDYEQGTNISQKSLELKLASPSTYPEDIATGHNNLGVFYGRKGEYQKALDQYQRALDIRLEHGLPIAQVLQSYNNIGTAYIGLFQFEKALPYMEKVLEGYNQMNPPPKDQQWIESYNNLGLILIQLEQFDQSLSFFNKALVLNQKTNHYIERTYHNLGHSYIQLGNYELAKQYLYLALEKNIEKHNRKHPDIAIEYRRLGEIFTKQRDFPFALNHFQQALIALSIPFEDTTWTSNPSLEGISSPPILMRILRDKAAALAFLAETSNDPIPHLTTSLETYQLLSRLIDQMHGQYEEETREFIAKETHPIFEKSIRVAHQLYEETKDQQWLEVAFGFAEKSKATLLLSAVRESLAMASIEEADTLIETHRNLQRKIAFYEQQVDNAEQTGKEEQVRLYQNYIFQFKQEEAEIGATLTEKYPEFAATHRVIEIPPIEEIRSHLLDEKTALIEYVAGDSAYYIFTLSASKFYLTVVPRTQNLAESLINFQQLTSTYPPYITNHSQVLEDYKKGGYFLYESLVAPARSVVPPMTNRFIVIPDGELGTVPFEALLTKKASANSSNYFDLDYLLKEMQLDYAYSATLLLEQHHQPKGEFNYDCLAFAPLYTDKQAQGSMNDSLQKLRSVGGALPFAQEEVSHLKSLFKGNFYVGESATKTQFLETANQYKIIHLAMHGISDSENPMRSHLSFQAISGSQVDDYQLFAYELPNLTLRPELVVMSACETGVGKVKQGEGIMSLARAFMYTGTESLVMSLWQVDDQSTQYLMKEFYQGIANGKSIGVSLQQSKLHYLNQSDELSAHPFYWAGFVFLGEDKPLSSSPNIYLWVIGGIFLFAIGILAVFRKGSSFPVSFVAENDINT